MKLPKIKMPAIVSRARTEITKKAPDLLMWGGVMGVLGGTAMACRATIEAKEIFDNYKAEKHAIETGIRGTEDEVETRKAIRKLQMQTGGQIAKAYAPAIVIEGLSLTGMCTSHQMMKKINTELGAVAAAYANGWAKYRENIRKEYGEEADQKAMYGYREEEIVEVNEDGEQETKKVKIFPAKAFGMPSPYARYFCYGEADGAEQSHTYNRQFLLQTQGLANAYLGANKMFMLNDLYDMLGYKRTIAGNRVGWARDKQDPSGDNYIDLRIQEIYREKEDKPGEWEKVFLIDPNVDGMVEEKLVQMGLMAE